MAYIYKIINLINQKLYIGKTSHSSIEERFKEHIQDSKKERNEKRPLYDAFNKYGIENFKIEEIEEVENDDLACEREQYWINELKTYIGFPNSNGYNATLGGDSRRLYDYKELANAYLELGSLIKVSKKYNCSEDTVQTACKENNIKILSGAEYSKNNFGKKIFQLDKDTEEIIASYDSISEAFRALGKTKNGAIGRACKTGKICLGYKWKYQ